MGKINSRAKGQRAERELCKKFEDWWGVPFFRTPGSGSLATMGFKFKDMDIHGDLSCTDPKFPFCIESKHHENWDLLQLFNEKNKIEQWWEQACTAANGVQKQPLLIFKKNRSPSYVMYPGHVGPCITRSFLWKYRTIALLDDVLQTEKNEWL